MRPPVILRIAFLTLLLGSCIQVNVKGGGSGDEPDVETDVEPQDVPDDDVAIDTTDDADDIPDVEDEVEDGKDVLFAETDEPEVEDVPDEPELPPAECGDNECTIGAVCYADGATNPANPCEGCKPSQSKDAFVAVAGACDDNDECTSDDLCKNGVCAGTEIPNCGPVEDECTYHKECDPAGVCARWKTTNSLKCSKPCGGIQECLAGQMCSKLPGSANIGYCEDLIPGVGQIGAECASAGGCSTGLCAGQCVLPCMDAAACAPGTTCLPADDGAGGLITFCAPDDPGLIATGQACTQDGNSYGGAVCQSGHCDLLGNPPWNCAGSCTSEKDCAPEQECNLVFYATAPHPQSGPFSETVTQGFHDAYMACYSQAAPGFKLDGQVCTADAECQSGKCQPLDPNNLQTLYCTSFCTTDTDCPPNLKCRMDGLGLTSAWLTSPDVQTQGPLPTALTYVRVCRFP